MSDESFFVIRAEGMLQKFRQNLQHSQFTTQKKVYYLSVLLTYLRKHRKCRLGNLLEERKC